MNSRGVMTSTPRYPDAFNRSLSPVTISIEPHCIAQARNLSSSTSAHTCCGKGGQSNNVALRATNVRNGPASMFGEAADSSLQTRSYSVKMSTETANSKRPFCHASRIAAGGPPKKMPETNTFVSSTSFTIASGLFEWPQRHRIFLIPPCALVREPSLTFP